MVHSMIHEYYMKKVFELARKGIGHVSPNPLVGALVIKDEKILGQGFHEKHGGPHAEINAIEDALKNHSDLTGATLYINLEPCCHTDKLTPPCAPVILKHKLKKVVISNLDPNPKVNGKGIQFLKENGVEVEVGTLASEGAKLNEVFFKFVQTETPFIHLKLGQSLDGKIATRQGESKYITGKESLKKVHEYRHLYDAVLIGGRTLSLDNPRLTIRNPQIENPKQPLRIVLTKLEQLNFTWNLISDDFRSKTVIVTTNKDYIKNAKRVKMLTELGVEVVSLQENMQGYVDLHELMGELASRKLTSILVEGGTTLVTQFLKIGLYDKLSLFIAPLIIGEGQDSFGQLHIEKLSNAITFDDFQYEFLGKDILFTAYRKREG
jgi:diaminohydroxyphosphoribosylaminopyrimidine deaminase/5-amino-6-(5-phosphoribosylamino)uracil reductase